MNITEKQIMKLTRHLVAAMAAVALLIGTRAALAEGEKTDPKAKPYTLKTCIVSGDKLGEMGKPYVFVHEGREIKLCCKGCLKDFKKEPAKYVKQIEKAEAKAKKSS